ncbi:MAG TPA: imidazole glycerol phosphate synthase subunit HisH, partial [Bacillota bacterium]|nr:imidazole glycerol phosphate synthase subunit HisH [Bacillota bacterium]
LLFEQSEEYGLHEGLGFLKGTVVSLEGKTKGLKIPHMGWNSLHIIRQCPILADTKEGDYVYFVHSYCASQCESSLCAVSDYGFSVPAVVADGSVYGCQFHPEKSGEAGLRILNAFARLTKENKA